MQEIKHHPKRGQIVTIQSGPLKGNLYHVIDYMEAQYQGKDIKRIKSPLLFSIRQRKMPLDSGVVFGKLLPAFGYFCVHDSELQVVSSGTGPQSSSTDTSSSGGNSESEVPKQPGELLKSEPSNVVPITSGPQRRLRSKPRNKSIKQ